MQVNLEYVLTGEQSPIRLYCDSDGDLCIGQGDKFGDLDDVVLINAASAEDFAQMLTQFVRNEMPKKKPA